MGRQEPLLSHASSLLRRSVPGGFTEAPGAVFVSGGTGYLGQPLLRRLWARGHSVRALVRPGSEGKLPRSVASVIGDVFDPATYAPYIPPAATLVHLVGTAHPAPWKARAFRDVDLASVEAVLRAATQARVRHIVYVSVAQPAPVMRAYVAARREAESLIRASRIPATILRPWYVTGPDRGWPLALAPLYALLERLPPTRAIAERLGLVRLPQMLAALMHAVEHPARTLEVIDVPQIRRFD